MSLTRIICPACGEPLAWCKCKPKQHMTTAQKNWIDNAAIASWDEERMRALREADRVKEWREKYEDLERNIRFIGKQIPCNTGGTFENDPVDAILDAAVRALHQKLNLEYEIKNIKLADDKTLDGLKYVVERTKVFEAIAEMLYEAGYDNIDAIKKIYETVREKYPVGTYYPPHKTNDTE